MKLTAQIQTNENYLLANFRGEYTKLDLIGVTEEVLETALKKGIHRVLLDAREITGKPPTILERFELGEAFTGFIRRKDAQIKCAFVGKHPMVDKDKFGETVVANRGGLLKVFTDIKEAAEWLTK